MKRQRWLWRRMRVAVLIALALASALRLLQERLQPGWEGWTAVRYAVGTAFVAGLVAYVALAVWRQRRSPPRRCGGERTWEERK